MGLRPVNLAQIEAGFNLSDFVTNVMGYQGGLGVVEHDALLAVQPTVALVNVGNDGTEPHRQDLVAQRAGGRIENFPLPGKQINHFGNLRGKRSASGDDRSTDTFARWYGARGACG